MKENTCIRVFADQNQINTGKEKLEAAEKSFQRLARVLSLAGNEVRLNGILLIKRRTSRNHKASISTHHTKLC